MMSHLFKTARICTMLLLACRVFAQGILVTVEEGVLKGSVVGEVAAFKGVPFVAPPVGDLRWRMARPHEGWEGVRNALEYGSVCPQLPSAVLNLTSSTSDVEGEEDCLTLNIWTPNYDHRESPLPVMLFLHGGGTSDEIGASSYPLYEGYNLSLAGDKAVVVTANYRLGALGYLALDGLYENNSTGNWGLSDQRAALQWIQKNIAQFGGDPGRVTLFGQSAGACFALCHLVSKQSKGLFTSTILQSGISTEEGFPPIPLSQALTTGRSVVSAAGCTLSTDVIACMRAVDASTLVTISSEQNYWLPVIDFVQIEDLPEKMIASGNFNVVPVMLGANLNDTSLGVALVASYLPFHNIYKWEYEAYVMYELGVTSPLTREVIMEYYPYERYASGVEAIGAITNDLTMTCLTRNVAKNLASFGAPVYLYEFSYAPKTNGPYLIPGNLGSYHGAELPFVFNNIGLFDETRDDKESQVLAEFMSSTWVSFASSFSSAPANPGVVSHPKVKSNLRKPSGFFPSWPLYDGNTDLALYIYGANIDGVNGSGKPSYEAKAYGPDHNCQILWDTYLKEKKFE